MPGRLSKSTPIRDVVKEGQDIIVQVTKEPIGTKGARCSSHISLPGRYVVYLPTLEHVGVSKRIGSDKERARLRETIDAMKPPTGGLIVRTVAEGLTKKQLKQDVGYLVRLWGEVAKKREGAQRAEEPARASSTSSSRRRAISSPTTSTRSSSTTRRSTTASRASSRCSCPSALKDVVFFNEDEPIFDAYGIEDEIARALSRKVPLPSGGYLIIDEAEALTAIDVNTGRFVGKGSKDMEETILKTNLEAVQEIAYQLRFRNIGGLIILDLIDMEKPSNREKVRRDARGAPPARQGEDDAQPHLGPRPHRDDAQAHAREPRAPAPRAVLLLRRHGAPAVARRRSRYEILREIRSKRHGPARATRCSSTATPPSPTCSRAARRRVRRGRREPLHAAHHRCSSRTEYHLEQFDLTGK